jgi:hypothetical protein
VFIVSLPHDHCDHKSSVKHHSCVQERHMRDQSMASPSAWMAFEISNEVHVGWRSGEQTLWPLFIWAWGQWIDALPSPLDPASMHLLASCALIDWECSRCNGVQRAKKTIPAKSVCIALWQTIPTAKVPTCNCLCRCCAKE